MKAVRLAYLPIVLRLSCSDTDRLAAASDLAPGMETLHLLTNVGVKVGGEEVQAGRFEKPHPSIFIAACRLANCQAREVHSAELLLGQLPLSYASQCHNEARNQRM